MYPGKIKNCKNPCCHDTDILLKCHKNDIHIRRCIQLKPSNIKRNQTAQHTHRSFLMLTKFWEYFHLQLKQCPRSGFLWKGNLNKRNQSCLSTCFWNKLLFDKLPKEENFQLTWFDGLKTLYINIQQLDFKVSYVLATREQRS